MQIEKKKGQINVNLIYDKLYIDGQLHRPNGTHHVVLSPASELNLNT